MSEREVEHEEVPREVQAGIDARRGGGAPLDPGVRERIAPGLGDPLTDVRIHTDTGAGTLARAIDANAFATGSDVFFAPGRYRPGTADGDRLLAHELAHVVQQRGAPTSGVARMTEPGDAHEREADALAASALARQPAAPARAPGEALVARDFIDDIKSWWGGEEATKAKKPKEVPVTKQDFDQVLGLVTMPIVNAQALLVGEADVAKARAAHDKVVPALDSLMTIANTKQEPKNRDNLFAGAKALQLAVTTLEVMAQPDRAQEIWKEHFEAAMTRVDQVLALPIREESPQGQGQAQPAANPDETLTQRDHDLINVGLKAQLQTLITTTSGEPYKDWDPKAVAADTTVPAAASAFTNRKLITVKVRVTAGLQAIKTFAMSLNEQQAEALSTLAAAQVAIAQSLKSYIDSDPNDPSSPSYVPPEEQ
jgi:Domain of unknown function (DUF4157)